MFTSNGWISLKGDIAAEIAAILDAPELTHIFQNTLGSSFKDRLTVSAYEHMMIDLIPFYMYEAMNTSMYTSMAKQVIHKMNEREGDMILANLKALMKG